MNSHYTEIRTYGGLTHPSPELEHAAELAESVFRVDQPSLHLMDNVEEVVCRHVLDVLETVGYNFPDCHNILEVTMRKYIRLRIHEHAKSTSRVKLSRRQFGSKTACRSTVII